MRSPAPASTAAAVAAIGITNQRETTLVWDRRTGKPIHNAIVWQDRRTADFCERLKREGAEPIVRGEDRPGARPVFLRHQDRLDARPCRRRARRRRRPAHLAFGTVDTFLLWRLTGGRVHATDATNASRTLLYDIHRNDWDDDAPEAPRRAALDAAGGQGLRRRFRRRRTPDLFGGGDRRSAASPATSRRRRSARPASSRAW